MISKIISIFLVVTVSSVIGQIQKEEEVLVEIGHEIRLQCPLIPENECAWAKNDGTIFSDDKEYQILGDNKCELRIITISEEHINQKIICKTTNTLSYDFHLIVLKSPEISIKYNNQEHSNNTVVEYEEGVDNVTCISAGGRPTPIISWKLNGQTVIDNSKVQTTTEEDNLTSVLQFDYPSQPKSYLINPEYDVQVECLITYQVVNGSETSIVGLTISSQYETTKVILVKKNETHFICEADGNPAPEIRAEVKKSKESDWKLVKKIYNNNDDKNMYKFSESGLYRCVAKTINGEKTSTEFPFGDDEVETSKDDLKADVGVAIGASLGGIFFVIIVVGISYFLYKKEKLCFAKSSRDTTHHPDVERRPNEAHENINLKVDEEKADTEQQEKDKSKDDE